MRNTTGYHPSQLTNHKLSAQSYMCTTGCTMRKTGRYYNSYDKPKSPIGHVNEYPTMHYFGNPGHSVNDSIHNFDRVFPEIPARYCILGYSLTCPIKAKQQREIISAEDSRLEDTMETVSISESDNQNAHKLVSMNEKPGKKCLRHAI